MIPSKIKIVILALREEMLPLGSNGLMYEFGVLKQLNFRLQIRYRNQLLTSTDS